ncbi:hypothetical protein GCM10028778_03950 [Barrientosiimonas marina]|uniref:YlzJ-like family protein n=1 Tax=Lentibacillus kimchii TaxID=1542911 RepID=A0ABW2UPL2_9BACI
MLHTPLATTDIFPDSSEAFEKRLCVSYKGKQLYVEKMDDGSYQVLQLLSSDPQDFMNSDYLPGTMLR